MSNRAIDLAAARILVSNDDGINAPGLKLLVKVARALSRDVWVVAPEQEQSGASHSLTVHRPLRIRKVAARRFAVDGTPTDCVLLAVNVILRDKRPTLMFSGVNRGGNPVRWTTAAAHAPEVIRRLTGLPWPRHTLINVNFPDVPPEAVTGIVATRQGRRKIGDGVAERVDPRGRAYYWIGPLREEAPDEPGTDLNAVTQGKVSLTPIYLDLTNGPALAELKRVFP